MAERRLVFPLLSGVAGLKAGLISASILSFALNVFQLALPIYSMQIYDRVLPSGSQATLVALTLVVAGFLVAGVVLDGVRCQLLIRLGNRLDVHLRHRLFEITLQPEYWRRIVPQSSLRDLDLLRQFLAGPVAPAFLDLPWTILYIIAAFMLHPLLGFITVIGALLVLGAALLGEIRAVRWTTETQEHMGELNAEFETALAGRDSLRAMGILGVTRQRLLRVSWAGLASGTEAANRTAWSSASSRGLRSLLQVGLLVGSAILAIANEIPTGAIVASTMLFTRALMPIDRIASCWRAILAVNAAATNLSRLMADSGPLTRRLALLPVKGCLEVRDLSMRPDGSSTYHLERLSFDMACGKVLVVVGSSGSGKSILARLLVGALRPSAGSIRLDGAAIEDWDEAELGRQVGYLSQEQESLIGTVAEIIARGGTVDDKRVTRAAGRVGAHEMILRLPYGYQTQVGRKGVPLSAGQRRVISFARACYGDPAFLVLDDPTAYLDEAGERVTITAINEMRALGSTIVVITRQKNLVRIADSMLWLEHGRKKQFSSENSHRREQDPNVLESMGGAQAS